MWALSVLRTCKVVRERENPHKQGGGGRKRVKGCQTLSRSISSVSIVQKYNQRLAKTVFPEKTSMTSHS